MNPISHPQLDDGAWGFKLQGQADRASRVSISNVSGDHRVETWALHKDDLAGMATSTWELTYLGPFVTHDPAALLAGQTLAEYRFTFGDFAFAPIAGLPVPPSMGNVSQYEVRNAAAGPVVGALHRSVAGKLQRDVWALGTAFDGSTTTWVTPVAKIGAVAWKNQQKAAFAGGEYLSSAGAYQPV
jgi:hypothetical protein